MLLIIEMMKLLRQAAVMIFLISLYCDRCTFFPAPKPVGRRARKPGVERKPRQAYSSKQLDRLESEFKVILFSCLCVQVSHQFYRTRAALRYGNYLNLHYFI